jgi:hypothetical protein
MRQCVRPCSCPSIGNRRLAFTREVGGDLDIGSFATTWRPTVSLLEASYQLCDFSTDLALDRCGALRRGAIAKGEPTCGCVPIRIGNRAFHGPLKLHLARTIRKECVRHARDTI